MDLVRDLNVCGRCGKQSPVRAKVCLNCGARLVLVARGAIEVWRLGPVDVDLLARLTGSLRRFYRRAVRIQPAVLVLAPSLRSGTHRRLSADRFLEQVEARRRRGVFLSLGVTERNIASPPEAPNFVFGLGRVGGRAAVVSTYELRFRTTPLVLAAKRAFSISTHELGHALGLEHHAYGEGVRCSMVGEVELDSVHRIDRGTATYCDRCWRVLRESARGRVPRIG